MHSPSIMIFAALLRWFKAMLTMATKVTWICVYVYMHARAIPRLRGRIDNQLGVSINTLCMSKLLGACIGKFIHIYIGFRYAGVTIISCSHAQLKGLNRERVNIQRSCPIRRRPRIQTLLIVSQARLLWG